MYEFCYNYVKPKVSEKAKLCYMDTDSFIVCIKANDIYKDITGVETRFDSPNYELDGPLPEGKKYCLEATQLENQTNHLEKNKTSIDSIKNVHKEFIRNNKLTLKHSKDLKVKGIMFLLKILMKLL